MKPPGPQQGKRCAELLTGEKLASTWARGFVPSGPHFPLPSFRRCMHLHSDEKRGMPRSRDRRERGRLHNRREICFIRFSLATENSQGGRRGGEEGSACSGLGETPSVITDIISTSVGKDETQGRTGRGGLLCSHSQLGEAHRLCGKLYACSLPRGEEERDGERNMRRRERKSEGWEETNREGETITPNVLDQYNQS